MKRLYLAALIFGLIAHGAFAQTVFNSAPNAGVALPPPLPGVEGALSWDTLANVELDFEGVDLVPQFAEEVRALDGQKVKMVGFLLSLDGTGLHQLLSVTSPHCPFCLPGGPESLVELWCDEPIAFTTNPVIVTGKFDLINDPSAGYYYRMDEVELAQD